MVGDRTNCSKTVGYIKSMVIGKNILMPSELIYAQDGVTILVSLVLIVALMTAMIDKLLTEDISKKVNLFNDER